MRLAVFVFLVLFASHEICLFGGVFREFTDIKGRKIEASLEAVEGEKVIVRMRNGKRYPVSIKELSGQDQEYIQNWQTKKEQGGVESSISMDLDFSAINELIGHPVFRDDNLWDDLPSEAGERLGWPMESETNRLSSYRLYPRGEEYRFLGTRPYSCVLYGHSKKVARLSLVFANKGDLFRAKGSAEDHFDSSHSGDEETLKRAIRRDSESISKKLTSLLGEGTGQYFGEGKDRRRVQRWDFRGHSFLLSTADMEYVSLGVERTSFADSRGKTKRTKDSEIKTRSRANVERKENGDVIIQNIPMVDQGPKGYCVPATFERCMRYLDIPADMYLLAMSGGTGLGGGTYVSDIVEAVDRDVRRKGRSMRQHSGKLKTSFVAKYIDEGLPIMWSIFSTEEFNKIANERKTEREQVSDWDAWAEQIKESDKKAKNLHQDITTGHVVMIIGYNKATKELAISDSWGPQYEKRWVSFKEAERVCRNQFYIIDF